MTEVNHKPKPFLRWAGSKRQLLPELLGFWTASHERYVEPFMGSACLWFAISPSRAVLGDINPELITTFKAVRRNPKRISQILAGFSKGKRSYYSLRRKRPNDLPQVESAARFIFLNRYCFNGLYRTNLDGHFNVPYGGLKTGVLPSESDLLSASRLLRSAELRVGDFEKTLAVVQKNDFVYLDPPFAVANRRIFRQYGPDSFGLEDLRRLAEMLKHIDSLGATFVLSYAFCSEALKLFACWPMRRVMVHRNIAGFSRSRRTATELLFSNSPLLSYGVKHRRH